MTNQQAAALRKKINHLAIELEKATAKAEIRCLKQSIRAAEEQLSGK